MEKRLDRPSNVVYFVMALHLYLIELRLFLVSTIFPQYPVMSAMFTDVLN